MIEPTDFLYSSLAPDFKTFKVFVTTTISSLNRSIYPRFLEWTEWHFDL